MDREPSATGPTPDHDLDADLAAVRGDASSRFATYAVVATIVFLFGTYLQSLVLLMPPVLRIWMHGKLLILLALAVSASRTSKLRPVARILHPAVSLAALVESAAWAVALFAFGAVSYFSVAAVAASMLALSQTPVVFRSIRRAEDARERLAANGIDDPFA